MKKSQFLRPITKGQGNDNGKTAASPDGDAGTDAHGNNDDKAATHQKLKLREEANSYFYDGLNLDLLKEYKDLSAAKAEYYYANGQVIGRKMFGYKGSILPDRERDWPMAAPSGYGGSISAGAQSAVSVAWDVGASLIFSITSAP